MKNYKIVMISLLLLIFMMGAVSAADLNETNNLEISDDISISEENLPSADNIGEDQSPASDIILSVSAEDSTGENNIRTNDSIDIGGRQIDDGVVEVDDSIESDNIINDNKLSSHNLDEVLNTDVDPYPGFDSIVAEDMNVTEGDGSRFEALFLNADGATPNKNGDVIFVVEGSTDTVDIEAKTDDDGIAGFDVNMTAGNYTVMCVNFATGEEFTVKLVVNGNGTEPEVPENDTIIDHNSSDNKLIISFTDIYGVALANTEIKFIIGESTHNATTDQNGTVNFDLSFLEFGEYTITIINPVTGQKIVKNVSLTTNETLFAEDVSAIFKDGSRFTAFFTDKYGKALTNNFVTFYIGTKEINETTDVNGNASFIIDFNAGTYNVTIVNPVTGQIITKTIIISPLVTKLSTSSLIMVYNTGKYLKATLKDVNGKALSKQKVYIKINGKTYERTTNANGQVSLKISLPVKTYTATITYRGSENYIKSSASAKVVVKKATPKLTAAKKKTFKTKIKKFSILLKDNKGKAMKKVKVTLTTKIKGKKVKLTVKTKNNGKATFNLKKLVKGKYTVAVKFAGNNNFKAVTKKVKITAKK